MSLYYLGGNPTLLQFPRSVKQDYSYLPLQMPCYQDVSQPMLVVIVGACGLASNIFGLLLFHGTGAFFSLTSPYSLFTFQSMVTPIHMAILMVIKRVVHYLLHMQLPLPQTIC